MFPKFLFHTGAFLCGSIIALWLAGLVASRRHKPGGWWMMFALLSVSTYCFGAAMEAQVVGQSAKVLWSQLEYIGSTQCAFCFFGFTVHYLGFGATVPRYVWYLLGAVPWLTQIMAWTNPWHHLVWIGFSPGDATRNVLIYHHGPVFWLFYAYMLVLGILSAGLIWRAHSQAQGLHRSQLALLFVGAVAPLTSSACYVMGWNPWPGMDVSPFGLLATGVFWAWSFQKYQLLDLVPAAREAMLDGVPDGMFVFDEQDRLVDINHAAIEVMGRTPAELIGNKASVVFSRWPALNGLLESNKVQQIEISDIGAQARSFEFRALPLQKRSECLKGRVIVMRDNTEIRRATMERERLIGELKTALAEVQTLSGLLPICAHCKKIRDDAGYWNQIDSYLSKHSHVRFTHGLCPECTPIFFPGIDISSVQTGKQSGDECRLRD